MKNIVLAFDGTWNTPDDEDTDRDQDDSTNVWKFYEAVSPSTPQGIEQIKWYEKGVGTNWYTKITGGVFGAGLSNRIQDGYQWLAEKFRRGRPDLPGRLQPGRLHRAFVGGHDPQRRATAAR